MLHVSTAIDASELIKAKEWKGLKTAAKLIRRRTLHEKTTEEVVYYISDVEMDATKIARAAREHWGVESAPQAHKEVQYELKLCA